MALVLYYTRGCDGSSLQGPRPLRSAGVPPGLPRWPDSSVQARLTFFLREKKCRPVMLCMPCHCCCCLCRAEPLQTLETSPEHNKNKFIVMNSVTLRVLKHPKSKQSWLCYPNGMKPFVITKSRAKALKKPGVYIVDLGFNSASNFVYSIKVRAELAIKKGK